MKSKLHLALIPILALAAAADDVALVKAHGTLLFEDEFSRDESTP